jgi:hypothetical protein
MGHGAWGKTAGRFDRNGEAEVDENSKSQITNIKQITMTKMRNSKPVLVIENATASVVPATYCGVSERTTIKWNLFLTFRIPLQRDCSLLQGASILEFEIYLGFGA